MSIFYGDNSICFFSVLPHTKHLRLWLIASRFTLDTALQNPQRLPSFFSAGQREQEGMIFLLYILLHFLQTTYCGGARICDSSISDIFTRYFFRRICPRPAVDKSYFVDFRAFYCLMVAYICDYSSISNIWEYVYILDTLLTLGIYWHQNLDNRERSNYPHNQSQTGIRLNNWPHPRRDKKMEENYKSECPECGQPNKSWTPECECGADLT